MREQPFAYRIPAVSGRLRRLPISRRLAYALALASLVAGCSASERLHSLSADPEACRPGTFIGAMAGNCPQPVR